MKKIVKPLNKWYKENKRILPWREEQTAYHVWISEIMLQQTRIEAVKKYYARFMEQIPTIKDLANIEEEKLLKLWEGLGYYNRARNLKKAAMMIQEKYEGQMPKSYEELIKLPGIGEYTAGAISSICYNEKVPAVDGNVLRVIARLTGNKENVLFSKTKKQITNLLQENMPEEAGIFNEAIMELGEVICIPNGKPLCEVCPIQKNCIAYQKNLTQEIPLRQKEKKRTKVEKTVFMIKCKDKIAIQKRKEKGLLAGMYEFPNVDIFLSKQEANQLLQEWNLKIKSINKKGNYCHIFTHIEWNIIGYEVIVEVEKEDLLWVTEKQMNKKYAIPTAFLKLT